MVRVGSVHGPAVGAMETSLLLFTSLLLLALVGSVTGLMCNYCYQADLRADCHLNVLECAPGHVCSVETSIVTFKHKWRGREHRTTMYRMGCEHYSMCRDRVMSGPGPLGYSITTKICCCNHLCEEADGVGENRLQNCPSLWSNYTEHANSANSNWGLSDVTLVGVTVLISFIIS